MPTNADEYDLPLLWDIAFDWDIAPELDRLVSLFAQYSVHPVHTVLELGCGCGRFLRHLPRRGYDATGIDIAEDFVDFANRHVDLPNARAVLGDMRTFDLEQRFDAAFCSANTFRHLLTDDDIRMAWRALGTHLRPGGVCVLDLELGLNHEGPRIGKWTTWFGRRGDVELRMNWRTAAPPDTAARRVPSEYKIEVESPAGPVTRGDRFDLRLYEGEEFAALATADGQFIIPAVYNLLTPHLFETSLANASGRVVIVAQRTGQN